MSPVSQSPRASRTTIKRFRPRLWSCFAVVVGCAVFVALGVWQIRRGEAKAAYIAQHIASRAAAPRSFSELGDADLPKTPDVLRVRIHGHYQGKRQLLMEGRSNGSRAGYDVLTPLVMANGSIIIVNRGWVARRSEMREGPAQPISVSGDVREIVGLWRTLPAPGLRLDAHNCRAQPWPRYVSYPTYADLKCLYGNKVHRGLVELSPKAADGYVRHWPISVGFGPVRHYGYAAQWFMFGIIALYLFYRLNLRRVAAPPGEGGGDRGQVSAEHPSESK